ncbi:cytochrome P450 [Crucibulum laeve]|uniref:Cytochrome P450 n=1 Tax=Crucibulum laeve TaxID=68775 RepID=A0A5C3LNR8_9AGAR|nr:cytochrome P450 [Crucibulum laeve]
MPRAFTQWPGLLGSVVRLWLLIEIQQSEIQGVEFLRLETEQDARRRQNMEGEGRLHQGQGYVEVSEETTGILEYCYVSLPTKMAEKHNELSGPTNVNILGTPWIESTQSHYRERRKNLRCSQQLQNRQDGGTLYSTLGRDGLGTRMCLTHGGVPDPTIGSIPLKLIPMFGQLCGNFLNPGAIRTKIQFRIRVCLLLPRVLSPDNLCFARRSGGLPLPPGPKGHPLIGNLRDLPTSFEWITYHKWCKDFGKFPAPLIDTDTLHQNLAGTSLIVLDTSEAATELLERRSSLYSGRARMPMVNELMGWNFNFGFMPYDLETSNRFKSFSSKRKHRRLMHQTFHPTAARKFRPHEIKATHGLLRRLLESPDDLIGNLRQMTGETIISIAYGLQVPEWVPGAGFKRKAKEWKRLARRMIELPYEAAKNSIAKGEADDSFVSFSLQKIDEGTNDDAYQEDIIQGTAGTMYTEVILTGSDTTVSAIASCILGLLEHPHNLQKARKDIDSVVESGHLPTFEDENALPYVTAITMEALR